MATAERGPQPVVLTMSYDEAKAFIKWLARAEGSGNGVQYDVWHELSAVVSDRE